jgi:hypothetical protein
MAVGARGRPVCVAAIDLTHDPDQVLYEEFYRACQSLDYADMRRLAKALGLDERAVRLWKNGQTFPATRGTAWRVIQWVRQGKPIKLRTQAEIAASMY